MPPRTLDMQDRQQEQPEPEGVEQTACKGRVSKSTCKETPRGIGRGYLLLSNSTSLFLGRDIYISVT